MTAVFIAYFYVDAAAPLGKVSDEKRSHMIVYTDKEDIRNKNTLLKNQIVSGFEDSSLVECPQSWIQEKNI